MNKKRLLKMADLLVADAKNKTGVKFDMSTFGVVVDADAPVSCGTSCCALGLAALSGAFKRAGLSAKLEPSGFQDEPGMLVDFKWGGRSTNGFAAARKLFGISHDESHALFGCNSVSPSTGAAGERKLAKKLRDFVAGKLVIPAAD